MQHQVVVVAVRLEQLPRCLPESLPDRRHEKSHDIAAFRRRPEVVGDAEMRWILLAGEGEGVVPAAVLHDESVVLGEAPEISVCDHRARESLLHALVLQLLVHRLHHFLDEPAVLFGRHLPPSVPPAPPEQRLLVDVGEEKIRPDIRDVAGPQERRLRNRVVAGDPGLSPPRRGCLLSRLPVRRGVERSGLELLHRRKTREGVGAVDHLPPVSRYALLCHEFFGERRATEEDGHGKPRLPVLGHAFLHDDG
jgi:hypothetical protein